MTWFSLAFISAFFWATSDIFSRWMSDKVSGVVGTFFLSLGMFLTMALIYLWNHNFPTSLTFDWNTYKPFLIMFIAGILNGLGFIFFIKLFQAGGNSTQSMPIVILFIAGFTLLYGVFLFRDPLNLRIIMGLILMVIAIYLLRS